MGILNDFERRLEGVIEGIFTKAFRTGVQPAELARRILKLMEANKTVGVREVWVPNRYAFMLSPADGEKFHQTEGALRRELEQVVRDGADERGWNLVGPAEVTLDIDPALQQGEFSCEASLVEGPAPPSTGPSEATRATEAPVEPTATPRQSLEAELILLGGGTPGKTFPLAKDRVVIGRQPESDVVVADPGVSRRHAEIRREDGGFIIADLGSTNGTRVNETTVAERTLEEGDRITVGHSVLEFRRR